VDEDEASAGQAPRRDLPGRPCSVAAALSLVGEKWALLAIREISFGNRRFDQIARNTGAPRDRLAARLRALEAGGVIERRPYSDHPPRYEYSLTKSGSELRPVLLALRAWGDKWAVAAPPSTFTHSCGHDLDPVMTCRHCGEEVRSADVSQRSHVTGWDKDGPTERARRIDAAAARSPRG
jgi:DNA-binding HxlR family transcriptional regulator